MRILLTGGAGQVGLALRRLDWPSGVDVVAPAREALNLSDPDALVRAVAERPWDLIVNCAAYTAVDRAESDALEAWRVNALAAAALAAESGKRGVPMIHVSTDYVFDGRKDAPYVEDDPVGPTSVYGASKEGGEQAVRTANARHVILRTAWVYGPDRANFVKTMLRVGAERPTLRVVDDQHGCPTSADDLARAIHVIALEGLGGGADVYGTFHVAGAGRTTWCGFARRIFELAGPRLPQTPVVEAIATTDYPTPARRPQNSCLDCGKAQAVFGLSMKPWDQALAETLDRLL